MDRQKDKIDVEELKKYRSFIAGFAPPVGDQAGFVSYFGVLKNERSIKLLDEAESQDVLELAEQLKWLMTKFHFRGNSYRHAGDFIFGDGSDHNLMEFLTKKHGIRVDHSEILYGQDEERPFLLLLPEIWREREKGTIKISDESLLNLRLKAEELQNPAALKYGDSTAMQTVLYAYHGWKELIRQAEKPPQQTQAETEFNVY